MRSSKRSSERGKDVASNPDGDVAVLEDTRVRVAISSTQLDLHSPKSHPHVVESVISQGHPFDPRNVYATYLEALIKQETRDHYLSDNWNQIIYTSVNMICEDIKLDLRKVYKANTTAHNCETGSSPFNSRQQFSLIDVDKTLQEFCPSKFSPMNILRYLHIKKILDNEESCQILNGIVFTGYLVNKTLPTQLHHPRILIIASSITYERNIYKRTWLESYAAQEEEYLGNCVSKILSFRPNVLLTGGGIANIALNMLVKAAIAIFCNVKRSVLARLAASTGAEIISCMDAFLSGSYDIAPRHRTSPIGACQWYRSLIISETYERKKALCIFSFTDLPAEETSVGPASWFQMSGLNIVSNEPIEERVENEAGPICLPMYSVILRGPDLAALKLVKRCFKLALLSRFNSRLELAYLNDAEMLLTDDPLNSSVSTTCAKSEDCFPSTLAQHLSNRIFSLSPLVTIRLPFLATSEGRRVPLFDTFSHFVDWPEKRRLNDTLKQKAVVMRARIYAGNKLHSVHQSKPPSSQTHHEQHTVVKIEEAKFLRRWTGKGRLIAMNCAGRAKLAKGAAAVKNSKQITKPANRRLRRSIRDARSHSRMYVLHSVYSPTSAICPDPWVIGIDVYGANDLPLGAFLEHFCFGGQNRNTSTLNQIQHFTQTGGSVKLTLCTIRQATPTNDAEIALPITMWTYCQSCQQSSRARPMSSLTWHLSFMKFIDFLINSPPCFSHQRTGDDHETNICCSAKSLNHCFSSGRVQATFSFQPIDVFEVCMPPISVWTFFPLSDPSLASAYATAITRTVNSKAVRYLGSTLEPAEMPEFLRVEVQDTLKKYYELTMGAMSDLMNLWNDVPSEELTGLLRTFEENLNMENSEIGIKSRVEVLSCLFDYLSKANHSTISPLSIVEAQPQPVIASEGISMVEEESSKPHKTSSLSHSGSPPAWMAKLAAFSYEEKITLSFALMYLLKRWLFNFANDWNSRMSQYNAAVKKLKMQSKQRKQRSDDVGGRQSQAGASESILGASVSSSNLGFVVEEANTTETFSTSRKDRSGERRVSTTPSLLEALSPESKSSTSGTVFAVKRIFTAILPGGSEPNLCQEPWPPSEHPQIPPPNSRSPLLLALTQFGDGEVASSSTAEATMPRQCANEKLIEKLSAISILRVTPDVFILDQEVTSIIAYALASDNYFAKLQTLAKASGTTGIVDAEEKRPSSSSSNLAFSIKTESLFTRAEEERAGGDNTSTADDAKSTRGASKDPVDPHIELQFADANSTFVCRIFYAEEFHHLRRLVLPQGEMAFIRSLSRCRRWDAKGGKSGSYFMKTYDERFVVKEVSSIELKTFHDISKQYFDYLITTASFKRLSLLARIFGIFHIDFKNNLTGDARRLDVLVMENLFHNRPGITHIYDLKGSLRGRFTTDVAVSATELTPDTSPASLLTTDTDNIPVLLDLNFINQSLDNPIYLRLHSKRALMHCLSLDTRFLSDLFIMDYSLLVGIDRTQNELVMGIIDYLRKFTLNKRLEMYWKQAITSAQGPMPTIIMPVDYRERLLEQTERNFHLVPDQWYDSLADHREVAAR